MRPWRQHQIYFVTSSSYPRRRRERVLVYEDSCMQMSDQTLMKLLLLMAKQLMKIFLPMIKQCNTNSPGLLFIEKITITKPYLN